MIMRYSFFAPSAAWQALRPVATVVSQSDRTGVTRPIISRITSDGRTNRIQSQFTASLPQGGEHLGDRMYQPKDFTDLELKAMESLKRYPAVREQLGLQLEMKKTPIDVLVIDRADKVPVPN